MFFFDIAPLPLKRFLERNPTFPKEHLIEGDFFQHQGKYDLILEQTFFCALTTYLRPSYVQQMKSLLYEDGKLVGLLFSETFDRETPPFGGNLAEYQSLFSVMFNILILEPSYNSIPPRAGRELFFQFSLLKQ